MHYLEAYKACYDVFQLWNGTARLEISKELLCLVLNSQKETHLWAKAYLCTSVIQALFSRTCLPVNSVLTRVWKDKLYKQALHIHTHKKFNFTISIVGMQMLKFRTIVHDYFKFVIPKSKYNPKSGLPLWALYGNSCYSHNGKYKFQHSCCNSNNETMRTFTCDATSTFIIMTHPVLQQWNWDKLN